ncbi:MAG: class IV adenylate cyclase [Gemmataceae bacterium]|nr:class IV adenylate cyclase [Gemmataceae bacterium]
MLEIEMKFPVADFAEIEAKLNAWNASPAESHLEADHYWNAPDRDFRKTDEAFRLRRVGAKNVATYKGPKHDGPAKTRTEIEAPLQDGDEAADLFCKLVEHLAYRPVAVVRKQRVTRSFSRDGFQLNVCMDDVEQVGRYVEVEIVAPEDRKEDATKVLTAAAAELGLSDQEKRSYLQLLVGSK